MKHLGDITKINWFEVEAVDVVTGGSPCQDLSVAGKRAGLAGERSGLYMEQIRCVKELRQADVQRGRTGVTIRPRFMVWENVPGAFSSGSPKGADFAAVIEEIVKVAEPGAVVHVCVPDRGWNKSGCYYAEDGSWSIAWRVHDAQFWGVPQRRKRISLVADFGGLAAPEILFVRKGLSGDFESCGTQGQGIAGSPEGGAGSAISFQERAGKPGGGKGILIQPERTGALSTLNNQSALCLQGNMVDRDAKMNGLGVSDGAMYSLNTIDRPAVMAFDTTQITSPQNGCNPHYGDPCHPLAAGAHAPAVVCAGFKHKQGALAGNIGYQEEQAPTLNAEQQSAVFDARGNGDGQTVCTLTGDHQNRVTDYTALRVGNGQLNQMSMGEQANTLDTMHDQQCVMVAHSLKAKSNCGFREDSETYPIQGNVVRRLTPLECERLQGYPDDYTNIGEWVDTKGKKHKEADSPRYKALGNSIALPFWCWLAKRISAQYERDIAMGSLFDGIGGFPYAFEKCGGKAVWASEIEEFPIAVTKIRFPE